MHLSHACVVIPAHNEAAVIRETITSLLKAGLAAQDIYLADDCSSDKTGDIGRELGVTVLRNEPNLGKAGAIKRIVAFYELTDRYDYIGLMDADTRVNDIYIQEMCAGFTDPDVVAVCGRPKSRPYNWITAYRAYGYAYMHLIYRRAQSKMRVINVAPGCSTMYRSSIWAHLDWTDDTIVEDMDVTIQIHKKKLGRIVYAPKAEVHTQDPRTLSDYSKQMLRWNTGAWQVIRKHRLFGFKDRIDLECTLLASEGIVFATLYLLLPFLLLIDVRFTAVILLDISVAIGIAAIVSSVERRMDIIAAAPLFPFMRMCDASLFLRGFWKVIIRGQAITTWFSPERYHG